MGQLLKISCIVITMISVLSCKSTKKAQNFDEKELRFSLSKGVCFGTCPVYELKVYHGGMAVFVGLQNTPKLGEWEKKLEKEDYKKLEEAFEKTDFANYPSEFKSRIPDFPMVSIGYHDGNEFRIVSGKEDRPDALMQAQFVLEKIVDNNNDWKLIKNLKALRESRKSEPSFIYEEVIIEIKKGLLLGKWIEKNSQYGVRLIKKIAPNLDYYLIGYDTSRITPNKFLKLLQDDGDIINAEFNKKTEQRDR